MSLKKVDLQIFVLFCLTMKRNFGIDCMRTLSIGLVLLQHGGINIPGLSPLKIGGIGVEIFFVLSGFLIGGILFRDLDKKNSFGITLKSFWTRRWLRILPLYYLIIAIKFVFFDRSVGWNILYYVFFLQNNFYGISFLDVSWSLVIEEWFYIFTPIFLFAVTYFLKSEKKVFFSMLVFILFVNVIRCVYVLKGNVSYGGVNGNFPFRFDSLFLGVVLSFLKHKNWLLFNRMNSKLVFISGISLFVAYLAYYWNMANPINRIDQCFFPRTLGFFILPFSIALTIPFMANLKVPSDQSVFQKLFFHFVNTTSILTYGIYLIHPFVFSLEINLLLEIGITYCIAWLVYRFFENPILKYRDKISLQGKV